MSVRIISLRRLPERAAKVSARLEECRVEHELFPAVDAALGEHLRWPNYDAAICLRAFGTTLLPSEIACFASHYSLWEVCARSGEPMLILEDDVTFGDGFPDVLRIAETHLPKYPLIRLAGIFDRPYREVERLGQRRMVRYSRGPLGTQAYVIAPGAAKALLRKAKTWREPVDHHVDRYWAHGVLPHAILPFEVFHEGDTEPTSTIGPRLRRRKGWHKLRREMNRLRDKAERQIFNLTR